MNEPDRRPHSDSSLPRAARSGEDSAFTLIELLVVIALIGALAALLFPTIRAVNRIRLISRARVEMAQMESLITSYKEKLGHYPPDNRDPLTSQLVPGLNPLYYELAGTVAIAADSFVTRDHAGPILTSTMIRSFFGPGVTGFVNSDRGDTSDGPVAQMLLLGVKPDQIAQTMVTNPATRMTVTAKILVCTVPGTDPNFPPLNGGSPMLNPWRYNSSAPTNNSTSYDLWTDILPNGKAVRICNWSSKALPVQ